MHASWLHGTPGTMSGLCVGAFLGLLGGVPVLDVLEIFLGLPVDAGPAGFDCGGAFGADPGWPV